MQVTHAIERTSPKGEKFIGKCLLCKKENLTFEDALQECSNSNNLTQDQAVILTIEGEPT